MFEGEVCVYMYMCVYAKKITQHYSQGLMLSAHL